MAHGRTGPDIVANIRYVGMSAIRAVSEHERDRTPDGASAIDPKRSNLNRILVGAGTQADALEALWASGVKRPAKQSESPFVQMVLSASPSYFRKDGQGRGEWDEERLAKWRDATLAWLKAEYGDDLVHVSLHLDEDTPHMHVLVVPTYKKAARKPGRKKRGESDADFEARREAAAALVTGRVAGRSSCEKWSRPFARRLARKSYHEAVEDLGLGYGRDFIEEAQPSPLSVPTGVWVRGKAADLAIKEAEMEAARITAESEAARVIRDAQVEAEKIRTDATARAQADAEAISASARQRAESEAAAILADAKSHAGRVTEKAGAVLSAMAALMQEVEAGTLGIAEGKVVARDIAALERGLPEIKGAVLASARAAEKLRQKEARADRLIARLSGVWDSLTAIFRRKDMPLAAQIEGEAVLRSVEKDVGKRVPLPSLPGFGRSRPAQQPVKTSEGTSGPSGP